MFQCYSRTEADCGTMSLQMDEDMTPEEEYLDDPIQLMPQTDNLTSYPEPAEFTAYKQQSYVPVTFFNIERNIKLLNNCRPLFIKLVDCNQYPWYRYERNNLQIYDSDSSENDDMYTENELETLSIEARNILNKISSNGLTIKVKTDKVKKKNKIKGINFKKNKGLIGMKISPTLEVIEIDDDSDDLRIDNENKEKITLSDVTTEVDEKSTDIINPASEITKEANHITETTHSNVSHDSRVANDVEVALFTKTSDENVDQQIAPNVKLTIGKNINEGSRALKEKDDAMRKEGKNENKFISEACCGLERNTHETSSEITTKTIEIINNDSENQFSIPNDSIISDSVSVMKEDECSKSPVFPCTPPKKMKKFTKDRHDTSKLVINHPKDFTDNKFKPNRLSSPKATSERLAEKEKLIQENITECIITTKNMPSLNSKTVYQQNREQIMSVNPDEKDIKVPNINDNIHTGVREGNPGELNLQPTSNNDKNDHQLTLYNVGKNSFKNLTSHEINIKNKQRTDSPVFISKSQTYNKEKIIRLKLDENIYKDIIYNHKSFRINNCKKVQKDNVDNVTSKASSPATEQMIMLKAGSLDQNNSKKLSIHIAEDRPSNSHSIDTILAKSKPMDTSKIEKKIGSAVLQEGTNNIIQGNVDKRPSILSKSRIRPFTGSISNWKSMMNELAAQSNCSQGTAAPIPKNFHLENSDFNPQHRVMAQNIVYNPAQKPQKSVGLPIDNNLTNGSARYQIAQTDHQETSARHDAIILGRNLSNGLHNSIVSGNNGPESVVHNVNLIAEQKRANVSQNGISRPSQNCYIPSFAPHSRQIVRPIMRQDGTQILSVTNYPRQMYSNTINNNSINPYVGYTNNYNSYWPYQYTTMPPPPPPPPPPPNSKSIIPNTTQPHGIVNVHDKNKVNVIKQIHFIPRPGPHNLQNNNFLDRPNLIDVNLNSTNPPKSLNNVIKSSQNIVSSKTEMFEELEKEMMNIHHEDSENFINNQLCDGKPINKHNNVKSDPRIKPFSNATDIAASQPLNHTAPIQSAKDASKSFIKPPSEDHDNAKNSRNTVLSLKRPSDKLILKDNIKKRKKLISTPNLPKPNKIAAVNDSSVLSYSAPILPIPTYKQTLDILTRASNDAQKRLEAFEKSRKQMSLKDNNTKNGNSNVKKDKVKKISLDEYKKRGDKGVGEGKKRKYERKKKDEVVKKCVEAKHSDQDQGYDSDSTMVL